MEQSQRRIETLQRQAATAFRKFLSLVFFDTPEVWPHIGYPGPTVKLEAQKLEAAP